MNPYRKTFSFDAAFPFEYVYRDIKSAQHELPEHVHDWYELVYIYKGQGTFFIDHSFYDAEAGDIFLIPGNTIHRSFPVDDNPKQATAFYFSASFVHDTAVGDSFPYLQPFEVAKQNQAFRLTVAANYQQQIIQLIEYIHKEYTEQKAGFRQAIRMHLQHILLLLSRQAEEIWAPRKSTPILPSWLVQSLIYMDANLKEELSLAGLASRAAVSPAHYSRIFKRLTGMNVTDYVTAKRIMKAKNLLKQQDQAIVTIAEECGFVSMTHFHRRFKALTGMTPAQYRRSL